MVRTGEAKTITLPQAVNIYVPDAADATIIRAELVKVVGKRRMKLTESLMKGYETILGQCSQEVKDKLEVPRFGEDPEQAIVAQAGAED
jgi:hypothetical protein